MTVIDPFTPSLKVDLIPEMSIDPIIDSDCTRTLLNQGYKYDLDLYIEKKDIEHF